MIILQDYIEVVAAVRIEVTGTHPYVVPSTTSLAVTIAPDIDEAPIPPLAEEPPPPAPPPCPPPPLPPPGTDSPGLRKTVVVAICNCTVTEHASGVVEVVDASTAPGLLDVVGVVLEVAKEEDLDFTLVLSSRAFIPSQLGPGH